MRAAPRGAARAPWAARGVARLYRRADRLGRDRYQRSGRSAAGYHRTPMTDLAADPRVDRRGGAPLQRPTRPARGQERVPRLLLGPFDGEPTPFEPGQYMTIGVMVDGKIVQRPYSVASPRRGRHRRLRVLRPPRPGRHVHAAAVAAAGRPPDADDRPEGQVHARAGRRPDARLHLVGDRQRAVRLDDEASCWSTARPGGRSSSTACRTPPSSATATSLEGWERSRRVPGHLRPDGVPADDPERRLDGPDRPRRDDPGPVLDELGLTPANSIAYICGNPDMILAAEETLLERGFPEEQIKKELYWPKGKEPRGVAGGATWPPRSTPPRRTRTSSRSGASRPAPSDASLGLPNPWWSEAAARRPRAHEHAATRRDAGRRPDALSGRLRARSPRGWYRDEEEPGQVAGRARSHRRPAAAPESGVEERRRRADRRRGHRSRQDEQSIHWRGSKPNRGGRVSRRTRRSFSSALRRWRPYVEVRLHLDDDHREPSCRARGRRWTTLARLRIVTSTPRPTPARQPATTSTVARASSSSRSSSPPRQSDRLSRRARRRSPA